MAEAVQWIVFHAHPERLAKTDDIPAEYYGIFVVPQSRREPESLLEETLSNRRLYLTAIVDFREVKAEAEWGSHEALKTQMDREGFGLWLTKPQRGIVPAD